MKNIYITQGKKKFYFSGISCGSARWVLDYTYAKKYTNDSQHIYKTLANLREMGYNANIL